MRTCWLRKHWPQCAELAGKCQIRLRPFTCCHFENGFENFPPQTLLGFKIWKSEVSFDNLVEEGADGTYRSFSPGSALC